jgi:hypothetical protein
MKIVSYSGKISAKVENEKVKKESKLLETKEIKLLDGVTKADWTGKK